MMHLQMVDLLLLCSHLPDITLIVILPPILGPPICLNRTMEIFPYVFHIFPYPLSHLGKFLPYVSVIAVFKKNGWQFS